ncbi:MAG: lactate utilization protein [Deltaproteobacteria bacterium]|jgi:hypothetical protein|nr:lactate utilization protein [Deltaproteobacteria bacterium]
MNTFSAWHRETLGKRAVDALEKNNFTAAYFPDKEAALKHALGLVPAGASVGVGGSATEKAVGFSAALAKSGHTVYDHGLPDLTPEQRAEYRHKQLGCDVFITGANAITMKGEIVNRDGLGNRVAAMIFGPKKVVIVAGVNKLVKDLEEADTRINMVAAPINNKRLNTNNPCLKIGECADCRSPSRICNITTILHRRPVATEMHVLLIGEELGF